MTKFERLLCECCDPECKACGTQDAECPEPVQEILYRRDMIDDQGTAFCEACGEDAIASGLFD